MFQIFLLIFYKNHSNKTPFYNIWTKDDILMNQVNVLDLSEKQYEFTEKAPKKTLGKYNIIIPSIKNC
jgi:hypothetical protein